MFLPVHDNYLWNKLTLSAERKIARGDRAPICLPMDTRVKLLKAILGNEETDVECHVLPFERDQAASMLKNTIYWERTLGKAQLPTIATSSMLNLFSKTWVSEHFGPAARLSLVFGIDNLPWMPSWSNAESLFSNCDLVLVRRLEQETSDADSAVSFRVEPSAFMRSFKTIRVDSINPIMFEGDILFGDRLGESTPKSCSPDATSTLYVVAPLHGLPGLSSTVVRRAIKVLAQHGYAPPDIANALMKFADRGKQTLDSIRDKAKNLPTGLDKV